MGVFLNIIIEKYQLDDCETVNEKTDKYKTITGTLCPCYRDTR